MEASWLGMCRRGRGFERTGDTRGQDCVIPVSSPLTGNAYADREGEESNLVTAMMKCEGDVDLWRTWIHFQQVIP